MKENNRYIGYIIKGSNNIEKSNKKVIFKVDDKIYIKKIREKCKTRRNKYTISESVNIICNDLNSDYVIIDSDNQPYFNSIILIIIVLSNFISMFMMFLFIFVYEKYIILSILGSILSFILLMFYLFYVVLIQPKKI